ncbi:MAG: hypothetical protein FGM25_11985 [Mycobacterium sp.]|nr:hypothetical protein [Mycobacterium sp.]
MSCRLLSHNSVEHVVESRSATPEPAGRPGNDTGVIRHADSAPVKQLNRFFYHFLPRKQRVDAAACLSVDAIVTSAPRSAWTVPDHSPSL